MAAGAALAEVDDGSLRETLTRRRRLRTKQPPDGGADLSKAVFSSEDEGGALGEEPWDVCELAQLCDDTIGEMFLGTFDLSEELVERMRELWLDHAWIFDPSMDEAEIREARVVEMTRLERYDAVEKIKASD